MIALGFPAYAFCRSERTGAWEKQPIKFSFPDPELIPSVRKACMPIGCAKPRWRIYTGGWPVGTDWMMAFRLDREQGTLSPAARTGPRHLAFHRRQPFAYVISELQSMVAETGERSNR